LPESDSNSVLRKKYDRAVGLLDAILDETGEDEKHPMVDLADAIGVFVERYEAEHSPIPAGKPADVLRFLMTEIGLRQSDFPEIGSQGCCFRDPREQAGTQYAPDQKTGRAFLRISGCLFDVMHNDFRECPLGKGRGASFPMSSR
jgi:antitoxin component HigA of HigAB toxin-antitoxin module